jgi:hypothetical protein
MDQSENPWGTIIFLAIAGLVLAYVLWRPDFVIRLRRGECRCKGKLPLVVQKSMAQFLLDDLRPQGAITIFGKRRNGRLRVWFWGKLTAGQKQRIRNFLLTHR